MKVLLVGDIVGKPGRNAFTQVAVRMKNEGAVDFIIANGENAASGRGPTPEIANALLNAGADVVTLGDHAWDSKEMVAGIDLEDRIIRPANFGKGAPGKGWVRVETPEGPLVVLQLICRVFMQPNYDCPFNMADRMLKGELGGDKVVFVDFHGEASSERMAMGRFLDGRVSAVFGTHTHCQTSDETVFPNGTAYITDLGMTGPYQSVLGRDVKKVLHRFTTGMYAHFDVAADDVRLCGALIEADPDTGRASSIRRVCLSLGR